MRKEPREAVNERELEEFKTHERVIELSSQTQSETAGDMLKQVRNTRTRNEEESFRRPKTEMQVSVSIQSVASADNAKTSKWQKQFRSRSKSKSNISQTHRGKENLTLVKSKSFVHPQILRANTPNRSQTVLKNSRSLQR